MWAIPPSRVVHDGPFVTVNDLREYLSYSCAFSRSTVAHDEEVHRLPLSRDACPSAKRFMEEFVVPANLFIDERNPVRQVHRQRLRAPQLRVEVRCRDQLRPAQATAMLPN